MSARYQVTSSLGKGGVSEVFRAVDSETGSEVAIKRLLPVSETRLNEPQADSITREALALSRLKHPNVIHLLDFGEDEMGPFAVLELIDGESLHDVIYEGALTYPDFFDVAVQTLGALAAAEDIRLLHRDLKPGNIMLTVSETGSLQSKILDFGVSKLLSQPSLQTVDHKGSILGSVDYVSPEQLDMQPLDHRADLYSLGCIFYYCLTQEPPFHGGSPAETVRNHLEHKVKPLSLVRPDLPLIVSDYIMKLIEFEPDHRPVGPKHALSLLHQVSSLEQVPGARLADLEEFTAPLSADSLLHQPVTRVDGHHVAPTAQDESLAEKPV